MKDPRDTAPGMLSIAQKETFRQRGAPDEVVISTEIADIFRSNALKNGLVPVVVDDKVHQYLLDNPGIEVTVDVADASLSLPDGRRIEFPIDGFARYCLVEGIDQLGFLQKQIDTIRQFEEQRSWTP